jgi:hypothetical protein
LETHCEALTGIGRGSDSDALRAIPRAEPVIAAAGSAGRAALAESTGRVGTAVGRTGASAITERGGADAALCSG